MVTQDNRTARHRVLVKLSTARLMYVYIEGRGNSSSLALSKKQSPSVKRLQQPKKGTAFMPLRSLLAEILFSRMTGDYRGAHASTRLTNTACRRWLSTCKMNLRNFLNFLDSSATRIDDVAAHPLHQRSLYV